MQLSILIPTYNVEKYINRCLDSIIKQQHFDEYELIIRNDGSTDNTLYIINEYAKKYKNIKVLTGENVGTLKCRELLVKEASGKYIWFIDGDDEITDNAIESILKTCDDWKIDFDLMSCSYKIKNIIIKNKIDNYFFYNTTLYSKIIRSDILKKINNSPTFINNLSDLSFLYIIYPYLKKIIFNNNVIYKYNDDNFFSKKYDYSLNKITEQINFLINNKTPSTGVKNFIFYLFYKYIKKYFPSYWKTNKKELKQLENKYKKNKYTIIEQNLINIDNKTTLDNKIKTLDFSKLPDVLSFEGKEIKNNNKQIIIIFTTVVICIIIAISLFYILNIFVFDKV